MTKQDRRIFTGIAEKASELVPSGHWFNQLSVEAKTDWLYSKVHWSADKATLLEKLKVKPGHEDVYLSFSDLLDGKETLINR